MLLAGVLVFMTLMILLKKFTAGLITVTVVLVVVLLAGVTGRYMFENAMESAVVDNGVFSADIPLIGKSISIPLSDIRDVKIDLSGENPKVLIQKVNSKDTEIEIPKWVLKSPETINSWTQKLKDIPELHEYQDRIQNIVDELLRHVE
jgi:hypothetical protein